MAIGNTVDVRAASRKGAWNGAEQMVLHAVGAPHWIDCRYVCSDGENDLEKFGATGPSYRTSGCCYEPTGGERETLDKEHGVTPRETD